MGYTQDLVSHWQMSDINPQDIGFRGLGNHGVGTGLVTATDIVDGIAGGKATEFNGTDEETDMGDVGTIRTVSLSVPLNSVAECQVVDVVVVILAVVGPADPAKAKVMVGALGEIG